MLHDSKPNKNGCCATDTDCKVGNCINHDAVWTSLLLLFKAEDIAATANSAAVKLHDQIIGQFLKSGLQRFQLDLPRHPEHGPGPKQDIAGHGGR